MTPLQRVWAIVNVVWGLLILAFMVWLNVFCAGGGQM